MSGKKCFWDKIGWKIYEIPGWDRKILEIKAAFRQVHRCLKDYPEKKKR